MQRPRLSVALWENEMTYPESLPSDVEPYELTSEQIAYEPRHGALSRETATRIRMAEMMCATPEPESPPLWERLAYGAVAAVLLAIFSIIFLGLWIVT